MRKKKLAPRHGFEPRLTAPKAAVLPLDDRGTAVTKISLTSEEKCLPFGVGRSLERRLVRAAFHVKDAWWIIAATDRRIFHDHPPRRVRSSHRVLRHLPQISFAHKVLKGLRRLLLINGVLIEHVPDSE